MDERASTLSLSLSLSPTREIRKGRRERGKKGHQRGGKKDGGSQRERERQRREERHRCVWMKGMGGLFGRGKGDQREREEGTLIDEQHPVSGFFFNQILTRGEVSA